MESISSILGKSKEQFQNLYEKYDKLSAAKLYTRLTKEIFKAVSDSDIRRLNKLIKLINHINDIENVEILQTFLKSIDDSLINTNLVILACKLNKPQVLQSLCENNDIFDMSIGPSIGFCSTVSPKDQDDESHNAFYYAIRSGNVEILETLVDKWPNNYFKTHVEELDELLSQSYEELKLKNVALSDEVTLFVESRLINLRFFCKTSAKSEGFKLDHTVIIERIEVILQNIQLLSEYSQNEVDDRFLFIATFIAQNLHILKRQIKSTYARLPWEEVEFCLIAFIRSQKHNLTTEKMANFVLTKDKILMYVELFGTMLSNEKNRIRKISINKLSELPKTKREKIVADIVGNFPAFEDLYSDYEQVRDVHSLTVIIKYTNLALAVNAEEKEGQLVITRVLQIIGEYLKNTLESPKMSVRTGQLLYSTLPPNTREIITNLRNSLSHACSLFQGTSKTESDTESFILSNVQKNIKTIRTAIQKILHKTRMKQIISILKKIIECQSLDHMKEYLRVLGSLNRNKKYLDLLELNENLLLNENENIKIQYEKLCRLIDNKTIYEEFLFSRMWKIIECCGSADMKRNNTNYLMGITSVSTLGNSFNEFTMNKNRIKGLRFFANNILNNISPQSELSMNLKAIPVLTHQIISSAASRLSRANLDKAMQLLSEIMIAVGDVGAEDVKWIEEVKHKLIENKKAKSLLEPRHGEQKNLTESQWTDQYAVKIMILKQILENNTSKQLFGHSFARQDEKSRSIQVAAIEMLMLDIMSILDGAKKQLVDNRLFLDKYSPLLIGKVLRNHLAHGNALLDILSYDTSNAIILNAKQLIADDVIQSEKKIGEFSGESNLIKLNSRFNAELTIVSDQVKLFAALIEGNLINARYALQNGADIYARDSNLSTALHFVAHSPAVDVINFVLNYNIDIDVRDSTDQIPLHVAASCGRRRGVELFLNRKKDTVNSIDHIGRTPLHLAARNGHVKVVEILMKNRADVFSHDIPGYLPLHYAAQNNHATVVKIMLENQKNVDRYEAQGGFTALHVAAEFGNLDVVKLLVDRNANVNAETDGGAVPMHAAALNGHFDVIEFLLSKGANVNARSKEGLSLLHNAVENGHEKVVKILLDHGAVVDCVDESNDFAPINFAARYGHEEIIRLLLMHGASIRISTADGRYPLHFAAEYGHLNVVRILTQNRAPVDVKAINGLTPIHLAAKNGYHKVVEFLIKNGAHVDETHEAKQTPLHVAAIFGHRDVMEILVARGANINFTDVNRFTALHLSAKHGHIDTVKFLIDKSAKVNTKNWTGSMPLHSAAENGFSEIVRCLIQAGAEIDAVNNDGSSALHVSTLAGDVNTVKCLIEKNADITMKNKDENTPLHLAVEGNHQAVTQLLLGTGRIMNIDAVNRNGMTPLCRGIKNNCLGIVKILVEHGANITYKRGMPLGLAVFSGHKNILDVMLQKGVNLDIDMPENATLLHLAATHNHTSIVETLIAKDLDINARTSDNLTALHIAAEKGHIEVVKLLLAKKANVNPQNGNGTPLHVATGNGHKDVVVVLLNNRADPNMLDEKNRTALELAIARGHIDIVKLLFQHPITKKRNKCNADGWTMLHIAAQEGYLEIVKYLVEMGADVNARDSMGSKAVHIAARKGHKDIVEYFLTKNISIRDRGASLWTLLHYVAQEGHVVVLDYLIQQKADINASDARGSQPIHVACSYGHHKAVEILLNNGAIYDAVDSFNMRPVHVATQKSTIKSLEATEKLFEAVKQNVFPEVERRIAEGAFINAKNVTDVTLLLHASCKGYTATVDVLLKHKANPNIVCKGGSTPLHYAVKFGHMKIVKNLLSHGAVYEAVNDNGKTPLDFATDQGIVKFLTSVSQSFIKVRDKNVRVVDDLKKIKDISHIKAVMNARNSKNQTLIVTAICCQYPRIDQLKEIIESDVFLLVKRAEALLALEKYEEGLVILRDVYESRKEIFGADNPATLDIRMKLAMALYKQKNYSEALKIHNEIYEKQVEISGEKNKDALHTRSRIGLILHRQGMNEEALKIFDSIYEDQRKIVGVKDTNFLETQTSMALVLKDLEQFDEALKLNKEAFANYSKVLGANNPATLSVQNNIAMVLSMQGNYDEALKIYRKVHEIRKRVLGPNHSDTLRTVHNMAHVLSLQKQSDEALKALRSIAQTQTDVLGSNHLDTLNSQMNIGRTLLTQGKFLEALKVMQHSVDRATPILGVHHPQIKMMMKLIEVIHTTLRYGGRSTDTLNSHEKNDIADILDNKHDIETLINRGTDINMADDEGRTLLHFAVDRCDIVLVKALLNHDVDTTRVTSKGNTPLHTAVAKNSKEIVDLLLNHVRGKKNDTSSSFINAQTIKGGTTCMHLAAKNGSEDIVHSLLKYGAIYDLKDFTNNRTPLELCTNENISKLLKLVSTFFDDAKNGHIKLIDKLKDLKCAEHAAVINARNSPGNTLMQVANNNKHRDLARKLMRISKTANRILFDS